MNSPSLLSFIILSLVLACSTHKEQKTNRNSAPQVPDADIPYRTLGVTGHLTNPASTPFKEDFLKKILLPPGWKVAVFDKDLGGPRMMVVDQQGSVYVSVPERGEIRILRDKNKDGVADEESIFLSGYPKVHGLSIHQNKLYFIALKTVYSVELTDSLKVKTLIKDLPDTGQHENRAISIGPDGKIYISIASNCNSCVDPNKMYGTMQTANLDGSGLETFASGLRDTIGFDWHPETGELYGMDHGTDWKGDEIPEEELNHLVKGKHYGWPFCWNDKNVDNNLIDEPEGQLKKDFCPTTESPLLTYTAHSSPIAFKFYDAKTAFVALRGSWNRKVPKGYSVVKITFAGGKPQKIEEFMTGFLQRDGKAQFGRPTGMAVLADGSLLVSEDSSGVIYRVSKK